MNLKGWKIVRKKDVFQTTVIVAPNGYTAVATNCSMNPENILFMLATDILNEASDSCKSVGETIRWEG